MSKIFDQLIEARSLDRGFLFPKYEDCLDSFLLPDMDKAVKRVKLARDGGEKVLIYGDYDVDGVTASTVLYDTLQLAGIKDVEIMLPNRFIDGYGMSTKVVQKAQDSRVNLVFTVDCGSRNIEIIDELTGVGIDTVVTDHHECGVALPKAVAVVNPKRRDMEVAAELQELAGVGVVFKLAQALVREGMIAAGQEKWLLDLVLLGTVCDSMKLTGENRRLCKYGLMVLEKTRRPGLKELMSSAGVTTLDTDAIGFRIGPRLNAAGRMDTAEKSLGVLMAKQRVIAAKLVLELEELNSERKLQQRAALAEIEERGIAKDPVIIERGDWHEGILGIVAGRLTEEHHRPAFVLSEVDGILKGSGRSFGDFNLAEALTACGKYIVGGGGHAGACGVKVRPEDFEGFKTAVNEYYRGLELEDQARYLEVKEDLAIRDLEELSLELIEEMRGLEPYGEGNLEPVFLLPEVRVVEAARLGDHEQHLRLVVWDQNGNSMKLMMFSAPEEYLNIRGGETISVWISLAENVFRGIRSIEGRILKIR